MIFLTYWFVVFAAVALPVYWLMPRPRARLWVLVATCVVFHAHFAGPAGVLPILALGALTYAAALTGRRSACTAAIVVAVCALAFYKYTVFVSAELLGAISPTLSQAVTASAQRAMPVGIPLAISFFTFEFVHYLHDVRAGSPPIRNPLRFAAFSIFWPSIVAGPVKRYQQFLPALQQGLETVTTADVAAGLTRVGVGLGKKLVAENLTRYIAFYDQRFEALAQPDRWVLVAAIGFRILLDFSGYSDMAIGYARMLGISLPENFRWPYLAASLRDFWQRWHISLSLWIRDYIYVPLGGSRHGPVRRLANGLIAFALCGLWHGAAWNFVAWGLYHGVGIAINSTYRTVPVVGPPLGGLVDRHPVATWALTFVYVMVGWLLFFYPVRQAARMFWLLVAA